MSTPNAYELKSFYNSCYGHVLRRVISSHLLEIWPECKDDTLMGYGYVLPYMRPYQEKTERHYVMMPSQLGVHQWPLTGDNIVCMNEEGALPIETNSVDRILVVHALEFSEYPDEVFAELWRVLKGTGKILIVVPNRMGFWSRADWTPFGQGRPYSARQVEKFLNNNLFVHEQTRQALFCPAFKSRLFMRLAGLFEKVGRYACPAMGGVHIIEASKQLYAGTRGTAVKSRAREVLETGKEVVTGGKKPVTTPRSHQ